MPILRHRTTNNLVRQYLLAEAKRTTGARCGACRNSPRPIGPAVARYFFIGLLLSLEPEPVVLAGLAAQVSVPFLALSQDAKVS